MIWACSRETLGSAITRAFSGLRPMEYGKRSSLSSSTRVPRRTRMLGASAAAATPPNPIIVLMSGLGTRSGQGPGCVSAGDFSSLAKERQNPGALATERPRLHFAHLLVCFDIENEVGDLGRLKSLLRTMPRWRLARWK